MSLVKVGRFASAPLVKSSPRPNLPMRDLLKAIDAGAAAVEGLHPADPELFYSRPWQ